MRHFNVIVIIFLMMASLAATGLFSGRTQSETERLAGLYRADHEQLRIELDNCARWKQLSLNMGGLCDGAFRGYGTMSSGPSCVAAETVGREVGLFVSGPMFSIPVRLAPTDSTGKTGADHERSTD